MTRNKKIVIPNITYSSGLTKKMNNLEVAKMAFQRLNNPKVSNLEKAKMALDLYKKVINPDFYKNLNFKVTVNSEKDVDKAKLMEELINYVTSGKALLQNYDKNTNQSGNSKSGLRAK